MTGFNRGFTLLEVIVALLVGSIAVATAAALLLELEDRAAGIERSAAAIDRKANGERVLRDLLADLDLQSGNGPALAGDSRSVDFRTWCETARGWWRPCVAHLTFVTTADGAVLQLGLIGEDTTLTNILEGRRAATIRYLVDAKQGGTWSERWADAVAPSAIAVIADADTLLLAVWAGS